MGKRHNQKGRTTGESRHVRLYHWLMDTAAWSSLNCVARCAYIEMSSRYAGSGSNNGKIHMSVREIAEALHVSKATSMRALNLLQDRGFIVLIKKGAFSMKVRHASEWRLTEFMCDVTGAMATKDFARWTKEKNTVSA